MARNWARFLDDIGLPEMAGSGTWLKVDLIWDPKGLENNDKSFYRHTLILREVHASTNWRIVHELFARELPTDMRGQRIDHEMLASA